jgi:capsular exopolysaccharide synthesis family protein
MDGKLIETAAASRALIGQCRRLAGALREMQASRGVKIVMVSSALPGEGRTLTVTNLALTLASQKQRVLLIDADLRRPSLHKIFGLSNTGGLREGLGPEQVQIPAVAVSPGLTVVSGGRAEADPSAILVSNSMKNLLQEAASTFDWVLLDTPPVSLLDDTHLLSWLTDGVLLVVQAGVTSRKTVASAVDEIGSERVIGTVLNRAGQARRFGLKGFR